MLKREEDLFWALRGGGGNFGVVTAMRIRLHELPNVVSGMLVYPFSEAKAVLRRYADAVPFMPDELTVQVVMRRAGVSPRTRAELIQLIIDRERKVDVPSPQPEPLTWQEHMRQRALQDERDGKCVVMRDPKIRPRLPRKPSWG
jgi:hypothetical protein